jgi:hypothetical protein
VQIVYDMEPGDVPMWKVIDVTDGRRTTWWYVRLWTGQIAWFKSRRSAERAYWR